MIPCGNDYLSLEKPKIGDIDLNMTINSKQAVSGINLRVVFDSNFNFSDHLSQVTKSTKVHARDSTEFVPF